MDDKTEQLINQALEILKRRYKSDAQQPNLRHTRFFDLLDEIKLNRRLASVRAVSMLSSFNGYERFFGISLIGQLCNPVEDGQEKEADEFIKQLSNMVDSESSAACLSAIAMALGYSFRPDAEPALLKLSASLNDDIRWSATVSFGSVTTDDISQEVVGRLLSLSIDKNPDIRDWATMHLGDLEVDTPEIRDALVKRSKDRHFDTRTEAIYGLALKNDARGIEPLKQRLLGSRTNAKDIEAAGIYGISEFATYLKKWQQWGYLQEWAYIRCSPSRAIRESVDDEWGGDETYVKVKQGVRRPIKYKEWDGSGSPWKD